MKRIPIPNLTFVQLINFVKKVFWNIAPNECWLWLGALDCNSRGFIRLNGKGLRPSRVIYKLWYGKDPGELEVCHTCDNPQCVSPIHLFLGTHEDNMADMKAKGRAKNDSTQKAKTHCPKGHEYNSANTIITNGSRSCYLCRLQRNRDRRAKKKIAHKILAPL